MKNIFLTKTIKILVVSVLSLASCSYSVKKDNPEIFISKETPFVFEDFNDYSLSGASPRSEAYIKQFVKDLKDRECENKAYCDLIPKKRELNNYLQRFNFRDVSKTQALSLENNLKILRKVKTSQLEKNYQKFLSGDCPKRTTAAVAQRLEFSNWDLSQKLFESANECGVDKNFENLYLRYALLNYNQGNLDKSKRLIQLALDVRQYDAPRSLYWASKILQDPKYAQELEEKYPYSFHYIKYSQENKIDLFKKVKDRRWVNPHRSDNELNALVESLLKKGLYEESYRLLNNNVDSLVEKDVQNLFYLIKLTSIHARHDYTVRLVSKLAYRYPQILNTQLLSFSYKTDYLEKFKNYSKQESDNLLFLSLSKQESGFYDKARSSANARGLMQILPSTARSISKVKAKDLYNVDNNIYLGTNYFYSLFDKYNSVEKALAAYNAGPGNVRRWEEAYKIEDPLIFMDTIPISETKNYVSSILRFKFFYMKMAEDLKSQE